MQEQQGQQNNFDEIEINLVFIYLLFWLYKYFENSFNEIEINLVFIYYPDCTNILKIDVAATQCYTVSGTNKAI